MSLQVAAFARAIAIPEHPAEDGRSFTAATLEAAHDFYRANGYVVLRGLVPEALCDAVRAGFETVRHSRIPILRQRNMSYERNTFNADGFLDNPIFNVQDLPTRRCMAFKSAALDLLTTSGVMEAVCTMLGVSRSKIVQSMFFEAPAGTWAHQDTYYQDSAAELGRCVAGWFALEDIDAGAGRFYVCPGSHRGTLLRNAGEHDFATGHDRYKEAIADIVSHESTDLTAPFLAKGDVLFWNSLTIHGSFPAARPGVSRSSLTAHYLSESDDMLQFHTRIREQEFRLWNGVTVGQLHNQDSWRSHIVREAASRFPGPYLVARKLALRMLMSRRESSSRGRQAAQ
ncbi:MAG: phytanoyl-CoA dioxygenase family protein [Alphaproteobacteria bacterium]|nr:phytanoyl-CoA dioxygenase family protein [Alphaproteobacteria bacterium]